MIKAIEFRANIPAIMSGIRTGGDGIRLTLDIPESDVQDAIALIALRNCPLLVTIKVDDSSVATRIQRPEDTTIADEKPKLKIKKVSGPYRYFWEVLHDNGLQNNMDILEVLDCTPDQVWDRLHIEFEVETMSVVSPPQLVDWIKKRGLPEGLITMSNNAQPVALRKEEEAKRKAESL